MIKYKFKKWLISGVCCMISFSAFCQDGFVINGNTPGLPDAKMYLLMMNPKKVDTLAVTERTNGKYYFTGHTREPIMVCITSGQPNEQPIPFFLDNSEITIQFGATGIMVEGGESQSLFTQYNRLQAALAQKAKEMELDVMAAMSQRDQNALQKLEQEFKIFAEQITQAQLQLLTTYNNSIVTAYMIMSQMNQVPLEYLKTQFSGLGEKAQASVPGKEIAAYIQLQEKLEIGQIAPDFTLTTPTGETISLHQLEGKLKLVDFWASWCGPCRQENPNMISIYKRYNKKGLQILGVSLDTDREAWEKAIKHDRLPWVQVSDLKGNVSPVCLLYSVQSIPYTVLLDENNRIIAKNIRGEDLRERIKEILK